MPLVQDVQEFRWMDKGRGLNIEHYIVSMCLAYPLVMMDVLGLGFGSLKSWYMSGTDDSWMAAECGCLVGSMAVATKKHLTQGQQLAVVALMESASHGGNRPSPAVNAFVSAVTILYADDNPLVVDGFGNCLSLYDYTYAVGLQVSSEGSYGPIHEDAVIAYISDLIRWTLTDMGWRNLPASKGRRIV